MGTLRGDNGGGRPSDGGGLPDLPPEWGVVIIPDDAAELDQEATQVRRELRRTARRERWRRRLGLPAPRPGSDEESPALGLPLLIMAIAIMATLTSLFALAWPGRTTQTETPGLGSSAASPVGLPDLTLSTAAGAPVRLRDALPAVLLLVDGCDCPDLIKQTAAAMPAKTSLFVIARSAPTLPGDLAGGKRIEALADRQGTLRGTYVGSLPTQVVVAVLVKGGGDVIKVITSATFTAVSPYLGQLG